jgi:hypothetical protein
MTELLDSSELPEQPEGRVTVGAALRYASLVWITSVLLSPVLLSFITLIKDGNGSFNGFFGIVFLFVLYGGALSIPNWLLFFGGIVLLTRQFKRTLHIRWGAQVWAVFLTVVLFYVLFGLDNPTFLSDEGWFFPGAYLLTLSVGIWYYPIRRG